MSNLQPIQSIEHVIQAIGRPTEITQDPRAGLSAIWGSRATGAFSVERGPIDSCYQVVLLPKNGSKHSFFKNEFSAEDLNQWFTINLSTIQEVLESK